MPFADLLPPLGEAQRAALKESIRRKGVKVHVLIDDGDMVIDGANRMTIVAELEAETGQAIDVPFAVIEYLDDDGKRELALDLNIERRQLSPAELEEARRRRVKRIAEAYAGGRSTREIADRERVSQSQVARDLQEAVGAEPASGEPPGSPDTTANNGKKIGNNSPPKTGNSPAPKTQGRDGKAYKRKRKPSGEKSTRGRKPKPPPEPEVRDGLGNVVPHRLADLFTQTYLTESADALEAMVKPTHAAVVSWAFWLAPDITDRIRECARSFRDAIPHALCPECSGAGCAVCKTSGVMPKCVYDSHLMNKGRR